MNAFRLKFIILLAAQIVFGALLDFTPMLSLCILPSLILALPTKYSSATTMLIAFALGFVVDFLCSGQLGLSSCALVVLALGRRSLISIVFGSESLIRGEDISIQKQSLRKVLTATVIASGAYFAVCIILECAGTAIWWQMALKWIYSVAASSVCGLGVSHILYSTKSSRWK